MPLLGTVEGPFETLTVGEAEDTGLDEARLEEMMEELLAGRSGGTDTGNGKATKTNGTGGNGGDTGAPSDGGGEVDPGYDIERRPSEAPASKTCRSSTRHSTTPPA